MPEQVFPFGQLRPPGGCKGSGRNPVNQSRWVQSGMADESCHRPALVSGGVLEEAEDGSCKQDGFAGGVPKSGPEDSSGLKAGGSAADGLACYLSSAELEPRDGEG